MSEKYQTCDLCDRHTKTGKKFDIASAWTKHRAIVWVCAPCADAFETLISKGQQLDPEHGLVLQTPVDYVEPRGRLDLHSPRPDPPKPL